MVGLSRECAQWRRISGHHTLRIHDQKGPIGCHGWIAALISKQLDQLPIGLSILFICIPSGHRRPNDSDASSRQVEVEDFVTRRGICRQIR
jgi:hypothetical protein